MEQPKMIQITEKNFSSIKEWVKNLNGRIVKDEDYFLTYTVYTNAPGVNDEIFSYALNNDWLINYRDTIVVCPDLIMKAIRENQ